MLLTSVVDAQEYDISLSLRYPAGDEGSLQPTALYVDGRAGDIYVVDASTSRIAIYDSQRRFNFEFSTRNRLASPRQVAVDSQGRIFVLGDTRNHTLAVFDYNGEFLNYLDLMAEGEPLEPAALVMDNSDVLYVLTTEPLRLSTFSATGEAQKQSLILENLDETTRMTPIIGQFLIKGEELYLPIPIVGQVMRMDLDGNLIRILGYAGGAPGELSFPAACSPTDDGGWVILDKHRHLLQFIGSDGRYRYEIGGAGLVEGWFFHPTALAMCSDGNLLVGQIYANRVQAVAPRVTPIVTGS